ncbi:HupE/UreJ family protein [Fimbriimonas ginsengisoli]|uniref:Membrane protein n=1 Tax=Fimbriimonas ginsengisoli Gsoil 348 TaxID=661478 RepID=A0A068NNM4_FIMGI|nr:HupE/UreJ family protein [Fimbriimonas ginsengisoli]AIE84360.1 Membrane protein [Fimbriimonas ginsengisoli Gsoil 348]
MIRLLVVLWMVGLAALSAAFHPSAVASAQAKIAADGSVRLEVRFDLLAFVLEQRPREAGDAQMKELLDLPAATLDAQLADAKVRFRTELRILADGSEVKADSFTFPTAADVQNYVARNGRNALPMMLAANLTAHLPKGVKSSSFHFAEVLDSVVLTTEFPYQEPISEPVEAGSTSTPLAIPSPAEVAKRAVAMTSPRRGTGGPPVGIRGGPPLKKAPVKSPAALAKVSKPAIAPLPVTPPKKVLTSPALVNARRLATESGGGPPQSISVPAATVSLPWYTVLPRYVRMGFTHILPNGLDHILFVLGLFLLSSRTRDLVKQVTAFTVAHSLTLGLALYGVVRLPSAIVEPVIALSIAFVAIENLFTSKLNKWRPFVVFGFGLVHGLGFASALQDLGLHRNDFLLALVGFNGGVELGQLTVVAAAFLLVGWYRSNERYRSVVAIPASVAIAAVALFWTVQRIL